MKINSIELAVTDHQKMGYGGDFDYEAFCICRKNLDLLVNDIYDSTKTIPSIGDLLSVLPDNDLGYEDDPLFFCNFTKKIL